MQHAGSDGAVYRAGGTPEERQARIVAGSSPEQLLARVGDARFVLTALGERPREGACDLTRIATDRAAIAGHSMGAWVAQAVAGQRFDSQRLPGQRFDSQRLPGQRTDSQPLLIDRRMRAAVAFSPTGDPEAATGAAAFGAVAIPFLSITGSFDGVPPSANPAPRAAALAARSAPHRFMPADGQKCLLVFGDASHMMFSGNPLPGDSGTTAHHVQAVSGRAAAAFLKSALAGARPNLTDAIRPLLLSSDSLDCK
jgi:pimeloyl-ACP methyl ester carboxylesterase